MGIRDWFTKRRRRAEALRRLGGPDLDAERKKNAMNGEQKAWVMTVMSGAVLLGWVAWNVTAYYAAAAERGPSPAEVLHCVDQCALSCVGEVMLEDAE